MSPNDRRLALERLHFELEVMKDFSVDSKDLWALDNASQAVYGVLVREKRKQGEKA